MVRIISYLVITCGIVLCHVLTYAQTSTINRPNDPVVLTGLQLPFLTNLNPDQIVGFKFINGTWVQIPIQVDERALLDIVKPYGALAVQSGYPPSSSNPKVTFYCDANTSTGADQTATFDNDDELVFMAKDAGGQHNDIYPTSVVSSTCHEITIIDPLGGIGYVYLFQNAGTLQQGAGVSYVSYTTNLPSTPGFPVNGLITNAENTSISTAKYTWHFSAEWVSDEFKIVVGNNTDILDRHKNFFSNGNCSRNETVFSAYENAYVTVKAGPVRVIRSYMGAVSGPLTQRTHIFYEGRHDIATDLRVHNIGSMYDAFDYNSAANGMIYSNNFNINGVSISGQQSIVTLGDIEWEQVSGTPGTVSILHRRVTNLTSLIEANFSSYYDDNSVSPASNCTGDGQAWGTSGTAVLFTNGDICTDPIANACATSGFLRNLQAQRIIYADAANSLPETASDYNNKFNNFLITSVTTCQFNPNYTITTSANPLAGGITTGDGLYASGLPVTVTAFANTGYTFTGWTESGNVVSTDATYTFTITGDRSLVADFLVSTTGIANSSNESMVSIFPNPSSGTIHISSAKHLDLRVFDALGQLILSTRTNETNTQIRLNETGIYLLQLTDEKGLLVTKRIMLIDSAGFK